MAKWSEHQTVELEAVGSSPTSAYFGKCALVHPTEKKTGTLSMSLGTYGCWM